MSIQFHSDKALADAVVKAMPSGVTPVTLTTALTTITHTAPGTADYAIQDLTTTTPYGFASQDEGNSVLAVIANLQARLAEVETQLALLNIVA